MRAAEARRWRQKTFLVTMGTERGQRGGNGAPWERCHVVLTAHVARRRDADNLVAGCKPILDGLFGLQQGGRWTRQGLLAGHDGDGQHEIEYRQVVDRAGLGVEVVIFPRDAGAERR